MHKASVSPARSGKSLGRAIAAVAVAAFWLVGDLGSICTTVGVTAALTAASSTVAEAKKKSKTKKPYSTRTRVVAPRPLIGCAS